MSVNQNIPVNARFISTSNIFSCVIAAGIYDFSLTSANSFQTVIPYLPNSTYFISGVSVGANISSEDYLSSISTTPLITLTRKIDKEKIFTKSFPVTKLFDNREMSVYTFSGKSGDEIQMGLSGILSQPYNLIGVSPVKITVALNIFQIDERDYNATIRGAIRGQI